MGAHMIRIHVLGTFQLEVGDPPRPVSLKARGARRLLAYLATHMDRPQARVHLAGILWPDLPEPRARRALNQAIWQARQTLGADAIKSTTESVLLGGAVWTDAAAFRAHVEAQEVETLEQGLRLYKGDFLPECYEEWALVERERLRDQYLEGLERLIRLLKQEGQYDHALDYARVLVHGDPLHEGAHRELIHLYLLLDQPARALHQYESLRALLLEELGVEPSAELQALHTAILSHTAGSPTQAAPRFATPEHMPLVGRRREQAALLEAVDRAFQGRGGFVLLAGLPGMGKSRLLQDLEHRARWRGMLVAYGQAMPVSGMYSPLCQAVAGLLKNARLTALKRSLPGPVCDAAAHVWPALGRPLSDVRPHQLRQALSQVLIGLARHAPLLLLLDDVHDADPVVLRVLRESASQVEKGPLLVVLAYRPLEARTRPAIWKGLLALDRACGPVHVELPPLCAEEQRTLVATALGTPVEAEVVAPLAAAAGDVPLYTLEMLRYLWRQDLLYQTPDGTWHLAQDVLPLPPTVSSLVQERAQRLPSSLREPLNLLAVVGEQVAHDLVVKLMGADATGVLQGLVQHGFLVAEGEGYRFTHALVREAIYESIPQDRRRALHARVAALLREQSPVSWGEVAWHLQQAGQGLVAVAAYSSAAREALDARAYEQAAAYCEAALALVAPRSDDVVVCDLLLARQEAYRTLGQVEEGRVDLARALYISRCLGDRRRLARACLDAGKLAFRQGRLAQARFFLTRSQVLWQAEGNVRKTAETLCFLADVDLDAGALAAARDRLTRAEALYGQVQSERGQAHVATRLGHLAERQGDLTAAERAYRRAAALARRCGDLDIEGAALNGLGLLALERRDAVQALHIFEKVLPVAERLGDAHNRSVTLHNLAVAADKAGHRADALARGEMSLRAAEASGNQRSQILSLLLLGSVHTACGQFTSAREQLTRALELAQEIEFTAGIGYAYRDLGILAREQGDLAEAVRLGLMSVDHFVSTGMTGKLGPAAYHLGRSLLLAGEPARAAHVLEQGLQHTVAPIPQAHLQAILAQVLTALGRLDPARAVVDAVRLMLEPVVEDEHLPVSWYAVAQAARVFDDPLFHDALAQAYHALQAQVLHVPIRWQTDFLQRVYSHRLIARTWLTTYPHPVERLRLTLPQREGKGIVDVVWTVDAGAEDVLVESRGGAIALRRHRLARLLREAEAQGAHPRHADLAHALGVSVPTVRRDLAVLRGEGLDQSGSGEDRR